MRDKKRKYANTSWHTRLDHDRPYQMVTAEGDLIRVAFMPGKKQDGYSLAFPRSDARLLAKRINQCLDATVKK